jgi:hypothetical protein
MPKLSDLISLIKQQQADIAASLVAGYVINHETYQRLVGQHQGLQKTLDLIDQLLNEDIGKNVE